MGWGGGGGGKGNMHRKRRIRDKGSVLLRTWSFISAKYSKTDIFIHS